MARVRAIVEDELELEGKIDIDVTEWPATFDLDLLADGADLGRLLRKLELADNLTMRAEHIRVRAESSGMSPRAMLKNTGIRTIVRDFEWVIPRGQSDGVFDLRFPEMAVSMLPGQPLGASTHGTVDGEPVSEGEFRLRDK